ncbi:cytochrome P450 [Iamia majanohamensis]|uniref:Cytochrome P450 n=1 Tax=Iamia majanohamensis TaxID=467976 RepID=A0AAE9Y4G3_9ACTN|nr:cytochrome P450 [Iamia majanohamensis]WCO66139.1 cytochrome P450 [Iamia majanohamensis]
MTDIDASHIDLLDLDRFTEGVPHEWFTWLRQNDPVHFHEEPDGPGFWVITRYDDVMACNRDAGTFSSAAARGGVVGLAERPASDDEAPSAAGNLMLFMDPPDHTRYRRLVNRGFTPRMIGRMEENIRGLTTTILDGVLPRGESDFVVDVAAELPLEVIAELIGVPHEDRHKIFDWSNRMIGADDPEYAVAQEALFEAQVEMFMYAQGLAEKHRQKPDDDIITALLSAEVDGESLSDMDFNLFFLLLSVAGNETTRNAISHGMNAFLENPDQYALLASDPERHIKGAVEEILRWASPVLYFRRNATRDLELRGRTIHEGDKISIWYISANRDEDHFDDPFTFDITRDPNPHIAFGGGGPHFCLGAQLARMEIQVLFEELVARVPRIEAVGPPDRLRSNFIGGIKHLPVRFAS